MKTSSTGSFQNNAARRVRSALNYGAAAGLVGLTLWACLVLGGYTSNRPVLVLFFIPILLSAYFGGLGPGLVATALSALSAAYFLFPPFNSFLIERPLDMIQLFIMAGVGGSISWLFESTRCSAGKLNAANAQLASLNRDLLAANNELENFSYSVSHDLRAPLRAITGFAEILVRRYQSSLNEEGRHYLDNIVTASRRMDAVIKDLLEFARMGRQTLQTEKIVIANLLSGLMHELQEMIAAAGVQIDLPGPNGLPVLNSDPNLLRQILLNLMTNAITYHRADAPGGPRMTINCTTADQETLIEVADNGIGIDPQYHELIFNIFQRLHSVDDYPGTGIGLATVKRAVERLGGTVSVRSTPGQGSTFSVRLPRTSEDFP